MASPPTDKTFLKILWVSIVVCECVLSITKLITDNSFLIYGFVASRSKEISSHFKKKRLVASSSDF